MENYKNFKKTMNLEASLGRANSFFKYALIIFLSSCCFFPKIISKEWKPFVKECEGESLKQAYCECIYTKASKILTPEAYKENRVKADKFLNEINIFSSCAEDTLKYKP